MKSFIRLTIALTFIFVTAFLTLINPVYAKVSQTDVTCGCAKKFIFYGYVKFRASYEDKSASIMGGMINTRRVPWDNTTKGENDRLYFNARQTRFGWMMYGDSFYGWKTSGRMEFDMYGGGHDHHGEVPRMRIGKLYLTKGNTKITMGKGWALFGIHHGPMVENFMTIVGNGFRRALMIDILQKFPMSKNTFGAELNVMTYDDDPKGAGFNTENLGFPYTSVELSLISKTLGYAGGKPLGLWLQGIYGNMAEPNDIYKNGIKVRSGDDYDVWGVDLDWYIPIISSKDRGKKAGNLAFSGKAYYGQALGNAAERCLLYTFARKKDGSIDEVKGYGGWIGLSYWVTNHVWFDVYGGYAAIDDKNDWIGADTWVNNASAIIANVWWRPARSIMFGLEYLWAKNEFIKTDAYGNDDAKLNAITFSAYYFF